MASDQAKRKGARPVWIALAVAIFGILAMLVVDHGPWSHPHAQDVTVAQHMTTVESARSAGANVAPTAPKSAIEPEPPGPKQAEPPNPQPR